MIAWTCVHYQNRHSARAQGLGHHMCMLRLNGRSKGTPVDKSALELSISRCACQIYPLLVGHSPSVSDSCDEFELGWRGNWLKEIFPNPWKQWHMSTCLVWCHNTCEHSFSFCVLLVYSSVSMMSKHSLKLIMQPSNTMSSIDIASYISSALIDHWFKVLLSSHCFFITLWSYYYNINLLCCCLVTN